MIENKVLKILNCRQTQANTDNTQSRINGVGNDESNTNFPQSIRDPKEKSSSVKRRQDMEMDAMLC